MPTATMTATGPLFDGRAAAIVDNAIEAGSEAVAEEAVNLVRARLGQVLRHPTGRYSSRVTTDLSIPDRPLVWDGGVVYGPWLEGTGGRNARSRFKGYRTFRVVGQELDARAGDIAGPAIGKALEGLNG